MGWPFPDPFKSLEELDRKMDKRYAELTEKFGQLMIAIKNLQSELRVANDQTGELIEQLKLLNKNLTKSRRVK